MRIETAFMIECDGCGIHSAPFDTDEAIDGMTDEWNVGEQARNCLHLDGWTTEVDEDEDCDRDADEDFCPACTKKREVVA